MFTKLLVKKILERPQNHTWSLQGLGMLRLYLSKEVRLHLWNPSLAFIGASPIHTHPWDFTSTVVAGQVANQEYVETPEEVLPVTHFRKMLKCGPGGGLVGEDPVSVRLTKLPVLHYFEGESYSEKSTDIHETHPEPGTVTIVQRQFKEDEDHAFVYWPIGDEWGSAEPRAATAEEVAASAQLALAKWF